MEPHEILHSLRNPAAHEDPYPLYALARRHGPIFPVGAAGRPPDVFAAIGYAAVGSVLRTPGFGRGSAGAAALADQEPQRPALDWTRYSALDTDPPDHTRMRRLMAAVFSPRRIASLEAAITAEVGALIDGIERDGADGAPVDFMDRFAFPLPISVICELLGIPAADRGRIRGLGTDLAPAFDLDPVEAVLGPADRAAEELAKYLAELCGRRRVEPRDDLISALVAQNEGGALTDDELTGNLVLLVIGGFETTTGLLGNGLAMLIDRPELQDALADGRLAAAAFAEEALRYDSPAQMTVRTAQVDGLCVEGMALPPGAQIILLLGAANRDPARFANPDVFDPARPDNKPLSFGGGAHYCLGATLARLEASAAFRALAVRLPGLAPAPGLSPKRAERFTMRGYESLPVVLNA